MIDFNKIMISDYTPWALWIIMIILLLLLARKERALS